MSRASPQLVRYAESHPWLVDTVHFNQMLAIRGFVSFYVALSIAVLVLVWVVQPSFLRLASILLVGYGVIRLSAYVLGQVGQYPQRVSIFDGVVEVKSPLLKYTFEFDACRWDLNARFGEFSRRKPAIYLIVRIGWSDHYYVTCLDHGTRALWRSFLALASGNE